MKNPKPWLGAPAPTADETREWRELTHPSVMQTLARYRDDLPQVYLREVDGFWIVCAKGDPGAVLFQPVHP